MAEVFPPGTRVAYLADHAYAQLTAVPAAKVLVLPDGVSAEQAASALLQGLTALTFVREAAGLTAVASEGQEGPWVLVHAAAGGVGTWFVQLLAALGARVIGTAGSADKCEIARQNGARWVVRSRDEDVVARVKEITGGQGVDVIFDGVGKATFDSDLEMIARKGTVVMVGNAVSDTRYFLRSMSFEVGGVINFGHSLAPCRLSISFALVPRTSSSCGRCCSATSPPERSWRPTARSSSG